VFPGREQWRRWSLPSKLTAIGTYAGLIGLVLTALGLLGKRLPADREKRVSPAPQSRLEVRLRHHLKHQISFSLVSTGRDQLVVENLYLRLRNYADCPLRNEWTGLAAAAITTAYSVQLSKDYFRYDLPPLVSPGDSGLWKYSGDSDEFGVQLDYPAYTLFVLAIEADGQNLTLGRAFHVSSDSMNFIDVANGNLGGCLILESWYSPELLREPPPQRYLEKVSILGQQILMIDPLQNTSFFYRIPTPQLIAVLPEIEAIRKQRPESAIFAQNVKEVVLQVKSSNRTAGSKPRTHGHG
jgi:hypothetical protein